MLRCLRSASLFCAHKRCFAEYALQKESESLSRRFDKIDESYDEINDKYTAISSASVSVGNSLDALNKQKDRAIKTQQILKNFLVRYSVAGGRRSVRSDEIGLDRIVLDRIVLDRMWLQERSPPPQQSLSSPPNHPCSASWRTRTT